MRHWTHWTFQAGLVLAGALFAAVSTAQVFPEPPPVFQIIRVPGVNAPALKPYRGAGLEVIAMSTITGSPETWFLEVHPSFASIEELDKRSRFEPPRGSQTLIAILRYDLSFRAADAGRRFSKARYFRVVIHQVRSGMERDYAEVVHLRRQAEEAKGLDEPEIVYQVVSGGSITTYLFIAPFATLSKLDDDRPRNPAYAENEPRPEVIPGVRPKIAPDVEFTLDNVFLRVDPRRSCVSDEFASRDRDFWRGGTQ